MNGTIKFNGQYRIVRGDEVFGCISSDKAVGTVLNDEFVIIEEIER